MKPNVLIFMMDQLNYQCLGFKGHPVVETPNLDRLKHDSVEFTRCYVQNAFCVPSRVSYLAGQYVFTHRQYGFHGLVEEDTPSMPFFFLDNGYETFHVGKAHVNCMAERLGFSKFVPTIPEDIVFATDPQDCYQEYCIKNGYSYPTDQTGGGDYTLPVRTPKIPGNNMIGTSHIPDEDSRESYTADRAIQFLNNRNGDQPFFMHVSFERPHHPLSPSEPYDTYYDPEKIPLPKAYSEGELQVLPAHIQRVFMKSKESVRQLGEKNMRNLLSQYYGLITHIDHGIGCVIDTLKQKGLYDNTVILFYTDHGDMAGNKGLANKYSNTIFHDDIIRTPMLLKLPMGENAGMEVHALTEAVDVFPTLAYVCGLDASQLPLQGKNLIEKITGERKTENDVAFCESYGIKTIIKGDWKLIYYVNSSEGELYNLSSDKEERKNLFSDPQYEEIVMELKLEIVKKMSKPVSAKRQAYIRGLFDESTAREHDMMDKLHKWDKNVADAGGFWMVNRNGYRFSYLPFDDKVILEKADPSLKVPSKQLGMVYVEDSKVQQALVDELLNYISTKIRPISLMSGNQNIWDNMLQAKGPGLC